MEPVQISLITPTYNERENLPLLAEEIFAIVGQEPDIDLELIVVDDNSPDGTGEVAESLKARYPVPGWSIGRASSAWGRR